MKRVGYNPFAGFSERIKTLAGKGSKLIPFKKVNGKRPEPDRLNKLSAKCTMAAMYARSVVNNADIYALYKASLKKGQSVYNRARCDYFKKPVIDLIDLTGYYGNPGDVICVQATDDFRVVKIKVMIYDINDMLIEEGLIEPKKPSGKLRGYYKVTRENKHIEGCVLRVIAFDLPGNEGIFEVTL